MTNQSHPARPDGDALLPCPFCKCADVRLEEVVSQREWRVRCEQCGCQTCWWHHEKNARESWNCRATSPARDAAEGVDATQAQSAAMMRARSDAATPPKPAPDAVRKHIVAILKSRIQTYSPAEDVAARVTNADQVADLIIASLSAPVPPADGALLEATQQQHVGIPKGEPAKFVRNGKLETCQCLDCRALSPSATGVAEPVVWWWLDQYGDEHFTSTAEFARQVSDGGTNVHPPYATPPVRGDREAIARIIDPTAFVTDGHGNWYPESISRRGTAMAIAGSILSLPVQLGAGERDQFVELIVERMNLLIETAQAENRWEQEAATEMRKAVRILSGRGA